MLSKVPTIHLLEQILNAALKFCHRDHYENKLSLVIATIFLIIAIFGMIFRLLFFISGSPQNQILLST